VDLNGGVGQAVTVAVVLLYTPHRGCHPEAFCRVREPCLYIFVHDTIVTLSNLVRPLADYDTIL